MINKIEKLLNSVLVNDKFPKPNFEITNCVPSFFFCKRSDFF